MRYRIVPLPSTGAAFRLSADESDGQVSMCPAQWSLGTWATSAGFPGGYQLQIPFSAANEGLASVFRSTQGLPNTDIAVNYQSGQYAYTDLYLSCKTLGGDSFELHYQPPGVAPASAYGVVVDAVGKYEVNSSVINTQPPVFGVGNGMLLAGNQSFMLLPSDFNASPVNCSVNFWQFKMESGQTVGGNVVLNMTRTCDEQTTASPILAPTLQPSLSPTGVGSKDKDSVVGLAVGLALGLTGFVLIVLVVAKLLSRSTGNPEELQQLCGSGARDSTSQGDVEMGNVNR
ncbi:hypothetical protein EBR57_08065, partial [bacterium]|nr:hypothetical protein [bacterium]